MKKWNKKRRLISYDRYNYCNWSRRSSVYRYWSRYWNRNRYRQGSGCIARQPEAESKISKTLILGCALAEATAIYGFIIALLIIFFLK